MGLLVVGCWLLVVGCGLVCVDGYQLFYCFVVGQAQRRTRVRHCVSRVIG